jgi:hypothetical protein
MRVPAIRRERPEEVLVMKKRSGEKAGWVAGWAGGFVWVLILALLFLYRQNFAQGLAGVALTGIAAAAVLSCAPWRHPSTPYWKLMLAPYGLFLVAVAWAVWSFGGPEPLGFNWWNLLWLMPALSPFGFLGSTTWERSDARSGPAPDSDPTSRPRS